MDMCRVRVYYNRCILYNPIYFTENKNAYLPMAITNEKKRVNFNCILIVFMCFSAISPLITEISRLYFKYYLLKTLFHKLIITDQIV